MVVSLEELKEKQLKSNRKRLKLLERKIRSRNFYVDFITITFENVKQFLKFKEKKFRSLIKNLLKIIFWRIIFSVWNFKRLEIFFLVSKKLYIWGGKIWIWKSFWSLKSSIYG
ncbi:MAG: hypothetical protein ACP5RD_07980, partial [bacterium]